MGGEIWCYSKVLALPMQWYSMRYLKVHLDQLLMYTANSRPTIKKTKNRGIIDMLRKESVEQAASAGYYQEQKSERTLHLGIGTTKENSAVRHRMEQHFTHSKHRETHREETEQNKLPYQTLVCHGPALIQCRGMKDFISPSPGEEIQQ